MRREELEHLLRSASTIAERRDVLVLGSQSILGTYDEDDLPEATTMSIEADLAFLDDDDQAIADRVDGFIGEDSSFIAPTATTAKESQSPSRSCLTAGLSDSSSSRDRTPSRDAGCVWSRTT